MLQSPPCICIIRRAVRAIPPPPWAWPGVAVPTAPHVGISTSSAMALTNEKSQVIPSDVSQITPALRLTPPDPPQPMHMRTVQRPLC